MLHSTRVPRRSGYTLVELIAVLAAIGIALAIAAPSMRRTLDRYAVRSARDAVAMELARTRLLARAHGGASLVLDARNGIGSVRGSGGDPLKDPVRLFDVYHARIDLGGADSTVVEYDRLGIGRMANRSVRVVRGDAEARLTISAYGRVRLW